MLHLGERFVTLRTGDPMRNDLASLPHYDELNEDSRWWSRYTAPGLVRG